MIKLIEGGVCAAKGFTAGGIHAGIRKNPNKKDLAIIYCEKNCNTAAIFTQNKVKAAPITVSAEHLLANKYKSRAIIVNSGNANAYAENSTEIAEKMCELTADSLNISKNDVLVASTGVIGEPLSLTPLETGIPALIAELSQSGSDNAANAIMTTDTFAKQFAAEFEISGVKCRIGGISKGSGMIHPNMATMLAFITTDVNISPELLRQALTETNSATFNMLSVDGDTSTNDTVCVMASGESGINITESGNEYGIFKDALYLIMMNLTREMARDGEGATKLIECAVGGAADEADAKSVAKSVISSSLVKAALGAADANWGRILCAAGYAEGNFDIGKVKISLASRRGQITVCENASGVSFSEDRASEILSEDEISVIIDLNSGTSQAIAWGCDLTQEYVKINADYRT